MSNVKYATYIRKIEIASLWNGRKHIEWELRPHVNILSGINGVGKTTIINRLVDRLNINSESTIGTTLGVKIEFYPSDATKMRFDVIRSMDRPFVPGNVMERLMEQKIKTELDWQLYQLQRKFLDYQITLSNRIIHLFTNGDTQAQEKAQKISNIKNNFLDLIDDLFKETGKSIDRESNELFFYQMGERLSTYKLSSGEKQILLILLTVLIEDQQPYVLLMDEPEVSLHVEWQQRLISLIQKLNPNAQIILSTHSPAMIMDGWLDVVTDVADITV